MNNETMNEIYNEIYVFDSQDEATSALDTQSERIVQAALNKMIIGRTTVRPASSGSSAVAWLLVVLAQGRLVVEGLLLCSTRVGCASLLMFSCALSYRLVCCSGPCTSDAQ